MSLEIAVLFPAVMLIIFAVIQAGLYFHARSVALSAAQEGLRVAQAENGSSGAGADTARAFVEKAGGAEVMTGVQVDPDRTATRARVTVTGRPLSVIPGVENFAVRQTAAGPVERFTDESGP